MDIVDASIISAVASVLAASVRLWKGSIFFAGVAVLLTLASM